MTARRIHDALRAGALAVLLGPGLGLPLMAAAPDYRLHPQPIAPDVYVFEGPNENFTPDNGGGILNSGFIVGTKGVIVIDSGPSRQYGEQMRAAIGRVTGQPVVQVYISHAHPDHFLGSQAFDGVPVAALAATRDHIETHGGGINATLYRNLGPWMIGTTSTTPTVTVEPGPVRVAGRDLELIAAGGHSGADLMVLDVASGTLFTGDLVLGKGSSAVLHPDGRMSEYLASILGFCQRTPNKIAPPLMTVQLAAFE